MKYWKRRKNYFENVSIETVYESWNSDWQTFADRPDHHDRCKAIRWQLFKIVLCATWNNTTTHSLVYGERRESRAAVWAQRQLCSTCGPRYFMALLSTYITLYHYVFDICMFVISACVFIVLVVVSRGSRLQVHE